jgi:tRNA-2-methylthio-N6-dimethylallyladenosine synthase
MAKLACLETFGCQMNQLDSEIIRGMLEEAHFALTRDVESADLILFNTCSVRKSAENRVHGRLSALKKLKTDRPGVVIAVLGCMAQKDREGLLLDHPHVDIVCGTQEFPALLEFVARAHKGERGIVATSLVGARHLSRGFARDAVPANAGEGDRLDDVFRRRKPRPGQFHAYVSVMRGCDNYCSYCIVPFVRGRELSRPAEDVVEEVARLVDAGIIEITLLGQSISSYGKNLAGETLATLLRKVAAVPGLRRIGFITSHPADMTRDVFDAMREIAVISPYLHMPAQSGSTAVLARMNRGYSRERYLDLVREAKETVPGIAIASDFIVGFPGETDADFRDTVSLVEACRFSQAFIFKYSPRPGTKAADFADDVPKSVKESRNHDLLAVQKRISTEENAAFVGKTVEVLIEGPSKRNPSRLTGRARDHRIVILEGVSAAPGSIVSTTVTRATALALYASMTPKGKDER